MRIATHRSGTSASIIVIMAAALFGSVPAPLLGTTLQASGSTPSVVPEGSSEELSPAQRAYIAGRVYAAVQKYFAHWDDAPDLDLNAVYREYLDEAMTAPDRRGFSLASLAFMVRLNNSHTGFSDRNLYQDAGTAHGFGVRHLGGQWVVIESERPGLSPGDVIVAVDGTPIDDFYARVARYIPASTERYRQRRLFYYWGRYLFPLQYTLTLADGRTVAIDRRGEGVNPITTWQTEGRWLEPGRIAYMRVPSWNDPRFQARALELLTEYEGAAGLVIDVRRNNGGSTPVDFISALMERPWHWWAESTPMSLALFSYYAESGSRYGDFKRPQMSWPATAEAPDSAFTGRIVIIVDEGCHSACEDFTMPFKDNGRATIVGRATAGSSGQPYTTGFGDGMGVAVGAKREFFPDGSRFEGVGIAPDVPVQPTVEDLRAGRDVELETALEILRQIPG